MNYGLLTLDIQLYSLDLVADDVGPPTVVKASIAGVEVEDGQCVVRLLGLFYHVFFTGF